MKQELARPGFLRRHFPTLSRILRYLLILACACFLLLVVIIVIIDISASAGLRDARARAANTLAPLTPEAFAKKYPIPPYTEDAGPYYRAASLIWRARRAEHEQEFHDLVVSYNDTDPLQPMPQEDVELLAQYVEKNRDVLALLDEAAGFEECHYGVDLRNSAPLMPHLLGLRSVGRFSSLAAGLAADERRHQEALRLVRSTLKLARSFEREPLLVSFLVSAAMDSIVLSHGVQRLLAKNALSDEELAALQSDLEERAESLSIRPALEGEMVLAGGIFESLMSSDHVLTEVVSISQFDSASAWLLVNAPLWMKKGYLKADQAFALERYLDAIERADAAKNSPVRNKFNSKEFDSQSRTHVVSRSLMSGFSRAVSLCEKHRSKLYATAAAVAALRFKNSQGRWPKALGELKESRYIESVPLDPFTRAPLKYRVLDDGIAIYSVGENLTDDAGRPFVVDPDKGSDVEGDDTGGFRLFLPPDQTPLGEADIVDLDQRTFSRALFGAGFEAAVARLRDLGIPTSGEGIRESLPRVTAGENAADYYEKAFRIIEETRNDPAFDTLPIVGRRGVYPESPSEPLPPDTLETLREYVEANAEALELLHQGAAVPDCAYIDEWKGYETQLPHLSMTRWSARLLALAAWFDAEEGSADQAIGRIRDSLALSGALEDEPILVSQLVAVATNSITISSGLSRALSRSDPSDEALEALQVDLTAAAERVSFKGAMETEIGSLIDVYRRLEAGETVSELQQAGPPIDWRKVMPDDGEQPVLVLNYWKDLWLAASDGTPAGVADAESAYDALSQRLGRVPGTHILSPQFLAQGLRNRARMSSAALAVAALRYRKAHGSWPGSASQLQGTYLETLPTDPYSQRWLELKIEGDTLSVNGTNPDIAGGAPMTWFSLSLSEATGGSATSE